MARKWSNLNLPGALHYVTGNCINRLPVFTEPECCRAFLKEFETINKSWPAKLITYVLMPDHFHLISNPRDGRIIQKINYIHANPVKARLVTSAADYYWSGFRSFYCQGDEPLAVDHDWWWPDDAEKLHEAMKKMGWHSYWKRDEDK
jgi:hypothetical protein